MSVYKSVGMVIAVGLLSFHCADESPPQQGITAPSANGQLLDFAGATRGQEPGGTEDPDALGEAQGPLCIGIKPPEDAYLPLPEPEPTDTETDESLDGANLLADADASAEEPEDVGSGADSPEREIVDATPSQPEDPVEEEGDAMSRQWFASLDGEARDATNDETGDVEEEESDGGGSGFPLLPPVQEPEEPEEYDCTPAPVTCPGAAAPAFALFDFQPQSCGFQATYGLDLFQNHVTLVALLAAW